MICKILIWGESELNNKGEDGVLGWSKKTCSVNRDLREVKKQLGKDLGGRVFQATETEAQGGSVPGLCGTWRLVRKLEHSGPKGEH